MKLNIILQNCTKSKQEATLSQRRPRNAPIYECPVCKLKISRRLRKNIHITILSLFGGEIISEVFQPMWSGYLNVTDWQTDGRYTVASPHSKTRETKCRRYYRYRRYFKLKIPVYCRFKNRHGPSLHTPIHARAAINKRNS